MSSRGWARRSSRWTARWTACARRRTRGRGTRHCPDRATRTVSPVAPAHRLRRGASVRPCGRLRFRRPASSTGSTRSSTPTWVTSADLLRRCRHAVRLEPPRDAGSPRPAQVGRVQAFPVQPAPRPYGQSLPPNRTRSDQRPPSRRPGRGGPRQRLRRGPLLARAPDGRGTQAGAQGGFPGRTRRRRAGALHGARRQDAAGLALRPGRPRRRTTPSACRRRGPRRGRPRGLPRHGHRGAGQRRLGPDLPVRRPPGRSRLHRDTPRSAPSRAEDGPRTPRSKHRPRRGSRTARHGPGARDEGQSKPLTPPPAPGMPPWSHARRRHRLASRAAAAQRPRGQVLTRSDLRVPKFATADLTGRTVLDVTPRGKHLLTRIEGGLTLHSHLRMDGSWKVYAPGPALERRPRTPDPGGPRHRGPHGRRLPPPRPGAAPHRRRGTAPSATSAPTCWAPTGTPTGPGQPARATRPAPSARPCSTSATSPASAMSTRASCASCSGVDPLAPRRRRSPPSTSPDSPRSPRNSWRPTATARARSTTGRRDQKLFVYGRAPRPCLRCGTPIRVADQGDGSRERPTYWCPACQPGPLRPRAPTHEGRADHVSLIDGPSETFVPSMSCPSRRTTSPDAPHSSPAPPAASAAPRPYCSRRPAPPSTARTATSRACTRRRP